MIPDLRVPRVPVAALRRAGTALLVTAAAALFATACDKVPLTAPSNATIKLYTNTAVVPLGGTAQITATVIQGGGVAVHNGTTVSFTTSLGTIDPSDAETQDGKVTVTFHAGTQSGTAVINAYSGAASTTATGGTTTGGTTGGTTTTTSGGGVTLLVGAAAAATVVVTASPGTVSGAGGSSVVTATVLDANNNALPGVAVSFSTDVGTLSPTTATTGANGQASTTLTTFQTATVTVTAGPKITGTTKVTASPMPTITITPPATTPTFGLSSNFSVNIAVGSGGAPVTSSSIDFGDGTVINLGSATGTLTLPHTYECTAANGVCPTHTYTVTATATDASGQVARMSVPVDVFPSIPFPLTVTAPSAKSGVQVTLVATPGTGAPAILTYDWDFGDGTSQTTTSNTVPHVYTLPAGTTVPVQKTVVVTAHGADNRTGTGSTFITITP